MGSAKDAVKEKNRIRYIEPNNLPAIMKAKSNNGQPLDNITWDPEDMNIFVDLQVVIPSREYRATDVKEVFDFDMGRAKYQSLLSGVPLKAENGKGGNFLTTDWTSMSYQEIKNNKAGSKELLGINSINISFDSHMYPRVTMSFTDVRGSSLMQPQEQSYTDRSTKSMSDENVTRSFFSSLFKFPYPRFLLSVKGVYGTCVTFVLSVEDFKANFNSESGNFDIIIKFIGHMYGLYTDIPMNYLLIAPFIGSKSQGMTTNEYWNKQTSEGGKFFYNNYSNDTPACPIMTFLEFYKKFQYCLNQERGLEDIPIGENIISIADNVKEISNLDGFIELVDKLYEEIRKSTRSVSVISNGNTTEIAITGTSPYYYVVPSQIIEDIKEAYNNCGGDTSGFFSLHNYSTYPFLAEILDADASTDRIYFEKTTDVPNTRNTEDDIVQFTIGSDEVTIYSTRDSLLPNGSFALPPQTVLKNDIDAYKKKLEADSEERQGKAIDETKTYFTDLFGFAPTIENIMRMLFAHLDTFITCFYKTIRAIYAGQKVRTIGSLGWSKDRTDIESSSAADAHVPPFTAFFKEKDGKYERIYPGESVNLKGIPEVGLVEDMLNGIDKMIDWTKSFAAQFDVTANDAQKSFLQGFSPSTVTDVYYGGNNPYNTLSEDASPEDVLYFFISRMFCILSRPSSLKASDMSEIALSEATSFHNSKISKRLFNDQAFINLAKIQMVQADGYMKQITDVLSRADNKVVNINGNVIKSVDESHFPMTLNGIGSPIKARDDSGVLLNEEYSDADTETFKEKYFDNSSKDFVAASLVENFSPIQTGGQSSSAPPLTSNSDSLSPITLVQYNGTAFTPYYATGVLPIHGVNMDGWNRGSGEWSVLKKHIIMKGLPIDTYDSLDQFLRENDQEQMWVPRVGIKGPHNVLLRDENLWQHHSDQGDKYCATMSFLVSYYENKNTGVARTKKLVERITACDTFSKLSKLEYYIICGLHYFGNTDITQPKIRNITSLAEKIRKCFNDGRGEITDSIDEVFTKWVDGEFSREVIDKYVSVSGSTDTEKLDDTNFLTPFPLNDGKIDNTKTSGLQKYLVKLYCTIMPYKLSVLRKSALPSVKLDTSFYECIRDFFKQLEDFLGKDKTVSDDEEDVDNSIVVNLSNTNNTKNAIYYTLKNLYDRWLSMHTESDFKLLSVKEENDARKRKMSNGESSASHSEFANFAYVDSFYNDIGKDFYVNVGKLFELIEMQFKAEDALNILEFIGKLCQDNKLLFRCLPVYSNIYKADTFANIFTPHSLYGGTNRIGRNIGNTYLLMYTYEPSHLLDLEQDKTDGVNYGNDSFDIADTLGEITAESLEVMQKDGDSYDICAFGVTAAKQNQSYFTKINVSMDNPRVTDFSIANKFMLAGLSKNGSTINAAGTGQDMFSIYSNRSYDCTVEMMGCANIMPMMYFQLNNVPMFKGTYMITKVEHNIQNNMMTTKFTGTRQPKRYIPFTKNAFDIAMLNKIVGRAMSEGGIWYVDYGTPPEWRGDTTNLPVFYVNNVYKQMEQKMEWVSSSALPPCRSTPSGEEVQGGTKGIVKPKGNKCPRHYCAGFVFYYLHAAFNGYFLTENGCKAAEYNNLRRTNGFSGCDGYKMREFLAKNGFKIVAHQSDMATFSPEEGDVCVMNYWEFGHVCMYLNGQWVSDFEQTDWGKNYGRGHGGIGPNEYDVLVYRYAGVRDITTAAQGYVKASVVATSADNNCQPPGTPVYRSGNRGSRGPVSDNFEDFVVPENRMETFIDALIQTESTGESAIIGDDGASIGPLQIQVSTLVTYNDITSEGLQYHYYTGTETSTTIGKKEEAKAYYGNIKRSGQEIPQVAKNNDDRFNVTKARNICRAILNHFVPGHEFKKMCNQWNAGNPGHRANPGYYGKTKGYYDSLIRN